MRYYFNYLLLIFLLLLMYKFLDYQNLMPFLILNFHLKIVLELQQYLGCYPDFEQAHLPFFNLEEGGFQEHSSEVTRSGPVIADLSTLAKTSFGKLEQWQTSTGQRRALLDLIMDYMQLHATGFKRPKSIEIYRQVFG